jgi:hypothetical protein
MKAVGIVILFPLVSVITVTLYVHGGTARNAALLLLASSIAAAFLSWIVKRQKT